MNDGENDSNKVAAAILASAAIKAVSHVSFNTAALEHFYRHFLRFVSTPSGVRRRPRIVDEAWIGEHQAD
jgi:hypothetical protein